jgi:hypothetical protein
VVNQPRVLSKKRWTGEVRLVALGLNPFLFCICLQASAQEQKPITVRGRLVNIRGVGGESMGWEIQLDAAISVDGKLVDSIELEGLTKKAQKLPSTSRSSVSSPTGTGLSAASGQSSRSSQPSKSSLDNRNDRGPIEPVNAGCQAQH